MKFLWELAECTEEEILKLNPIKFKKVKHHTDHCYFAETKNFIYLVVDATDNFLEWVKNLCWFRVSSTGGALGFSLTARAFTKEFVHWLPCNDKPIVAVGRSRGGAVLLNMFPYLTKAVKKRMYTDAFCNPKPGGRKLAKEVNKWNVNCWHIDRDIVPKFPLVRGEHAGRIIKLKSEKRGILYNHSEAYYDAFNY